MVLSPNDFKLVASVSKQDEGLEGVSHSCSAGQFYPLAGQYNPPLGTNTPHMAPLMDEGIHSVKTLFQFLWSSSLFKIADSKIWPLHDVCVRISNKLNCWIRLKKIVCLKRILSTLGCTIELLSLYSLQDISLTILLPIPVSCGWTWRLHIDCHDLRSHDLHHPLHGHGGGLAGHGQGHGGGSQWLRWLPSRCLPSHWVQHSQLWQQAGFILFRTSHSQTSWFQ